MANLIMNDYIYAMQVCDAKVILHQYLIDKKMFGNYHYKGSGSNGHVFSIHDQIVKVTTDMSELETALFFLSNPHPAIIEYYDISKKDNCGVICMEEVTPLDPITHRDIILKWHEIINPDSKEAFNYEIQTNRMVILDLEAKYDLDLRELHWGNCGYDINGNIKIMDLRLV